MSWMDVFREKSARLYWQRLDDDHVVDGASGGTISPNEAYFCVRLTEMYLGTSRTLWRKSYPLVHAFTSHGGSEDHNVAGPGQLQQLGGGNLDRVVVVNARLTGPTPYVGGDVALVVGLWSVPGDDAAKALVATVGALSGLVGATTVPMAAVIDVVKSSVESILDLNETSLRLGVNDTFFSGNPLREGFHVAIAADRSEVQADRLWLRKGELVSGADPIVAKPYSDHDYFVIQIERQELRHDWAAISEVREASKPLEAAMAATGPASDKRAELGRLWPAFLVALQSCAALTRRQADKIAGDVAADLNARLQAIDGSNPFETKSVAGIAGELRDAKQFDLADVGDYVPLDHPLEHEPFG